MAAADPFPPAAGGRRPRFTPFLESLRANPARVPPKLFGGTRIDHPDREPASPHDVRTSPNTAAPYATTPYTNMPPDHRPEGSTS